MLQDVHWSSGLFGYFPTYQLGNVMCVQIWEAATGGAARTSRTASRWAIHASFGDWLRDHLYALGRKFTPKETLERVAGGPLDPEPYLRYLRRSTRRRRDRVSRHCSRQSA